MLIPEQIQFRVEEVRNRKSMVFAKNYEASTEQLQKARNDDEVSHTSDVDSKAHSYRQFRDITFSRTGSLLKWFKSSLDRVVSACIKDRER